jgi:hypothetical protein
MKLRTLLYGLSDGHPMKVRLVLVETVQIHLEVISMELKMKLYSWWPLVRTAAGYCPVHWRCLLRCCRHVLAVCPNWFGPIDLLIVCNKLIDGRCVVRSKLEKHYNTWWPVIWQLLHKQYLDGHVCFDVLFIANMHLRCHSSQSFSVRCGRLITCNESHLLANRHVIASVLAETGS